MNKQLFQKSSQTLPAHVNSVPLPPLCESFLDIVSPLGLPAPHSSRGEMDGNNSPGILGREFAWAKRWKLARIPQPAEPCHSLSGLVEAERYSASKYNTCTTTGRPRRSSNYTGGSWQNVRNAPLSTLPIQRFRQQCEKVMSDLCSISAGPRRQFAFTCGAFITTLRQTVCSSAILLSAFPAFQHINLYYNEKLNVSFQTFTLM